MIGGWLLAGLVAACRSASPWAGGSGALDRLSGLPDPAPGAAAGLDPLALLWLGIGNSARIFVVFIAAIVPWVMNSMQAVYSIDALLVRAARTLGASDRRS